MDDDIPFFDPAMELLGRELCSTTPPPESLSADPDSFSRGLLRIISESVHVKLDNDSSSIFTALLLADRSRIVSAKKYRPKLYGTYGGHHYFRPDGWIQFQVDPWYCTTPQMKHDKEMIDFDEIKDWPISYHGTSCDKLLPILSKGLRKPGELPEVVVEHGQCGAGENGAIYLTPSLWYASHPVYSPLKKLGRERWAQAALKI